MRAGPGGRSVRADRGGRCRLGPRVLRARAGRNGGAASGERAAVLRRLVRVGDGRRALRAGGSALGRALLGLRGAAARRRRRPTRSAGRPSRAMDAGGRGSRRRSGSAALGYLPALLVDRHGCAYPAWEGGAELPGRRLGVPARRPGPATGSGWHRRRPGPALAAGARRRRPVVAWSEGGLRVDGGPAGPGVGRGRRTRPLAGRLRGPRGPARGPRRPAGGRPDRRAAGSTR